MLRIHFTVADAMKVRVVVLGPLAELQLSLHRLQRPGHPSWFDSWRAPTVAGVRALSPDVADLARYLAPAAGLVDLFTLVGPADEHTEAVDRLCRAPAGPLRHEFGFAPEVAGVPAGWIGDFAHGDRAARERLTSALDEYHALAIRPYWQRIRAVLDNERATRVDVMATHGLDAMLAGMAPTLHWRAPVLEVPGYLGVNRQGAGTVTDVHLRGRGLVLAPSLFSNADPGLFTPWNDEPAVLLYPVSLDPRAAMRLWHRPGETGERALAGLLGGTRAAALRVIAGGCTTSELAQRIGISPGGASQHATVLREAGLVVSHRHRNTVRHTLTDLGLGLLDGA
ncbi:winged helix-turn-helix domain-containing protein [Actinoplanes oblitus]|uniref:Winged helix-turn-helix domain-containing protein n=1 Tax=Actinoplanes oblitus TaxID=3040509 RepID=A0ABY8WRB5_9ACTN|nr:winged helix-turn-helix domain-containing protein [Actinoplanes oblitus]WIM99633.1 winged helix-turn-helix domain-containing protein [Actinoplanes oblitus]